MIIGEELFCQPDKGLDKISEPSTKIWQQITTTRVGGNIVEFFHASGHRTVLVYLMIKSRMLV